MIFKIDLFEMGKHAIVLDISLIVEILSSHYPKFHVLPVPTKSWILIRSIGVFEVKMLVTQIGRNTR
jgi:hypothetical protein